MKIRGEYRKERKDAGRLITGELQWIIEVQLEMRGLNGAGATTIIGTGTGQ
jgi:hypothetical protein